MDENELETINTEPLYFPNSTSILDEDVMEPPVIEFSEAGGVEIDGFAVH